MRKAVLLFAILGFTGSACGYAYAARTVIECGGDQGIAWAEGLLARIEELESDMQAASAALESSTYLALDFPDDRIWLRHEMQPYVSRAKDRYLQQMAQTAPWCVRKMQELTAEAFYIDWKTYEAYQHGDAERVTELQDQSLAAMDAVSREYERLVKKYGWVEQSVCTTATVRCKSEVTATSYTDRDPPDLLRTVSAGESWLRGYSDGFKGGDLHEPEQFRLEYLRGYVAGFRARRS